MSHDVRKPAFCICENKDADQLRGNRETVKLISPFVFAIRKVQSLYNFNPKFQASSHLLWMYSLVCVGPGRKPRRPVFSERGSYNVSHVMRKPAFCICENKDADQLRGNREADQRLISRNTDSTIALLPKSEISSI